MKITSRLALAGMCLVLPFSVSANCLSAYSNYLSGGIFAAEALSNHPECFGGGATTSQVLFNATAGQQSFAISDNLARRWSTPGSPALAGGRASRGMAAGDALPGLNVWASATDEDTDQRYGNISGNTTKNDFDIQNYIVGADFGLSPALILGVSLAIDKGDISGINTAIGAEENELTSRGFMFAPYLGWQLNEHWALDASAGIGEGKLNASGSSRQEVERWYAGLNLNYQRWLGSWQFSGRASYLHAEEAYDDIRLRGETQQQLGGLQKLQNSDATNKLDRIQLGGQVGYWWNGWLPYAGLRYMDDVHRSTTQNFAPSDPIGREAWVWVLGVNYLSLAHGVSAGLAYEQEEGRGNQNMNTWMANLNLRF